MGYHDGELRPEDARELQEHLSACESCKHELSQLVALSELLSETSDPVAPPAIAERLCQSLPGRQEVVIVRLCRRMALAAAAIIALCSVGLWSRTSLRGDESVGPAAWEVAAVTLDDQTVDAGSSEVLAAWIVGDLTRGSQR
jgi:anti-sigma factor RsiW